MKQQVKDTFIVVGVVVLVIGVILGCVYGYLALYSDVKPRFEKVERNVFENTPSYVQGKAQVLTKLRLDFERAETKAQKTSLKQMILTEAATVKREQLPSSLQSFLRDLENGQLYLERTEK